MSSSKLSHTLFINQPSQCSENHSYMVKKNLINLVNKGVVFKNCERSLGRDRER